MFESLPAKFQSHGLDADVRHLLTLRKAMQRGLVRTLGDIHNVLKGVVVKSPDTLGPFTRAFYDYFLNIDIQNGETLYDAVVRSEAFRQWRSDRAKGEETSDEDLVTEFLDRVHLTQYDIHEVISGKDIWDADDPDLKDEGDPTLNREEQRLSRLADYSELTLEELLERLESVREQQRGRHSGGSHWLGTGGVSPYGHGGGAKDGLRVGGTGGGHMARKVLGDRKFFPVDRDAHLDDNNIDAAFAALQGIREASAWETLDVEETIEKGLKRGGLFIPELKNIDQERLQIILLVDNGGYSMDPYISSVQRLFRKMKTRFAHDLEIYYFHNTVYDYVFSDPRRSQPVKWDRILNKDPHYRIFIVGDAAMAPYELSRSSYSCWKQLMEKFTRVAWLNPEPQKYWRHTMTIGILSQLFNMYPLTPRGIETAVQVMNRNRA